MKKLFLTADEKSEHDRRRWKENARRAKVHALSEHRALVAVLGGVCAANGCSAVEKLEVDHVDGRLWRVEAVCFETRVRMYWAEFRAGVRLQALCQKHNGKDGGPKRYVKCGEGKRLRTTTACSNGDEDVDESEPLANEIVVEEISGCPF